MAPLSGFRLTLPAGDVFRVRKNVETTLDQQTQFLFNGGTQALALYKQFVENGGQQDRADSLKQSATLGAGAGTRTIQVRGTQYVDSQDAWGSASASDSATTKRDVFDQALATADIDSENPATLELGEFSTGGQFDPLPVVILQSSITTDTTQEASSLGVSLECMETASLDDIIHGQDLTG